MKLRNKKVLPKDFYPSGLIVRYTCVCRICNKVARGRNMKCPKCQNLMLDCGKRAKIPKKNDVKGWIKFWQWYDSRIKRSIHYFILEDA